MIIIVARDDNAHFCSYSIKITINIIIGMVGSQRHVIGIADS